MSFQPILSFYQNKFDYRSIDLSEDTLIKYKVDVANHFSLIEYLEKVKSKADVEVLYGGYLEKRSLYNQKDLFQHQNKQRNIHLGIDFWAEAGEDILCPFDGVVHSFANNKGFGNYGPCIILKHNKNQEDFYTLYGHLNRESLLNIEVGEFIKQNQVFCKLGEVDENGGYVPHLHFQIIKNIENFKGDYPGVCHAGDLQYYKANTVNPEEFLDL
ncbi:peptidoglycan DD-metalloendopeptidase family protein [Flavobacteriaceae bacterium 14752]|uniref:peptidoglycan DD-metalloendopeptidase family protein n=1 Tax=Mesohalobacter salilacus TaxID=2491711 RepID=UPI000F644C49|nr:peptidase M23 [Flavobacteriaceae bacterium 14752]